jgi:peptide/nickel transport system permease protein
VTRYILRRALQVVPVVFGVSVAVFLMLRLIPGDVVDVILGTEGAASPERLAELRRLFGLDRPFYEQYLAWLGSLLSGDFGRSIRTSRPILPDILARFPVTFQLTALAMVLSLLLAIPLGVISAAYRYTRSDSVIRVIGLLGLSIPNFWLATMMILFVSQYWRGVLPTSGYVNPSQDLLGSFRSVLLPAVALGVANMAILMRMTRSSMLEVLRQEYVMTARAKGLVERLVVYRHALRNALIPVVTVAGIQVGYLLGGAIIVEQIFALPGVGTLVLNGITQRDYPVVQAGVLFIASFFVLVNLVVDVLYAYLDPKIHYG